MESINRLAVVLNRTQLISYTAAVNPICREMAIHPLVDILAVLQVGRICQSGTERAYLSPERGHDPPVMKPTRRPLRIAARPCSDAFEILLRRGNSSRDSS